MNPLLAKFNTPFETAPFDKIKNEHFLPAIQKGIEEVKEEIKKIKTSSPPDFENTIVALENAGEKLSRAASIFFNINAAETNDEIQQLAREISPLLSAHSNDILLDETLFNRVKAVFDQREQLKLNSEQSTLLEKSYKSFIRNGALLKGDDKERLRAIDQKLSKLGLHFGENVLKETNKYELVISEAKDLEGLPDGLIEAAAQTAQEKGKEGKWVFTLAFPSYVPFMTYAKNRELRKEIYIAYNTKSAKGDDLDNRQIIKDILKLKDERAKLLGYDNYADFVLEERMAEDGEKVLNFLDELLEKAKPRALAELKELEAFAKKTDGIEKLFKWDISYYAEKLKMEKYAVDDELLKPYFELNRTIDGVFTTAEKLYGITFKENKDIPVYHPDVKAYEVKDENDAHLAVFYADFFPRAGKRNGAWMTVYRGQKKIGDKEKRPHVSIVCNFTKPTKTKPSLLTFNEVTTLFHEFGHALHGMLAQGTYGSLSGTNVYWDFVELPSQIFENWCYEEACLDLFAKHYETGEPIPKSYIENIKKAANFHQGFQTARQISLGQLDMAYHTTAPDAIDDVFEFENEVMKPTALLDPVPNTMISTSFSHIFQGGYAAGYYSYKWAEVLDADAFELFQEKGVFDKETAQSFKDNILSMGGKEHPSILYKRFRGRAPKPDALIKRAGLEV
ncbi:M3 family metallopeptidase [Cyclobacterium sp. 1_MG-2023]|uniref:M3 family metallopeptidase n=1 Tax=Cyclobacterium sp. 1_MG-2023 TaxID=3062681 RepID=UPI0026E1BB72|nr:M3 family metallopeptidase [Cyclobacterium sp. 1_MG-2023]MDO6437294.1 M3 family metallopeptidase [Cyclobacterium sp. 1_MG-2023]